jgi:hypothetical protein
MMKARILWTVGLICIVGSIAGVLVAQAPRTAQPASLDDLLAEVRGLRAEINLASSASIRTQLLTARLQLQEQRIYTAARQLTEVQGLLTTVRQEILEVQRRVEQYERDGADSAIPPDQLKELRLMIPREKAVVEQKRLREQELRTQETELFNALNTEQARWTEFNDRLDEIERSLSGAR